MTINFESMNWYLHLLNMSNMTVPPHTQMNVMLKNLLETNILLEFCNKNEWKCSVIAVLSRWVLTMESRLWLSMLSFCLSLLNALMTGTCCSSGFCESFSRIQGLWIPLYRLLIGWEGKGVILFPWPHLIFPGRRVAFNYSRDPVPPSGLHKCLCTHTITN